jgi:hypothetical protein
VIVHVPADELDVLLKGQGKGMLLRYADYAALRDAAQAKSETAQGQPPVDGALLAATGTLDLTGEKSALIELAYRVRGLAPGPRAIPFASAGLALESVEASPEAGSGRVTYEEKDGQGRLFLEGPGAYAVKVKGSVPLARGAAQRFFDVTFPDASAFALEVKLPRRGGHPDRRGAPRGAFAGGSAARRERAPGARRAAGGQLGRRVRAEGPACSTPVKTLHTVGDGVVQSAAWSRWTCCARPPTGWCWRSPPT